MARSGASRSGYTGGGVFIGIGAAQARTNIQYGSLSIIDNLDEAPNRCTFTLITGAATLGQEVVITLGSVNNGERLFAGHVLTVERHLGGTPDQVRAVVSCVDYTWQLGFMKVTERYTTQSATTIAAHLIARYTSGNGFTSAGVAANLPTVDEITFTNEDLAGRLHAAGAAHRRVLVRRLHQGRPSLHHARSPQRRPAAPHADAIPRWPSTASPMRSTAARR